jgi:apolipoprotein N-acyltransferase
MPTIDFAMAKKAKPAPADLPGPRAPMQRWTARVAMLAMSVILLSLALAPADQFYLAWVGLVPWLLVVNSTKTKKGAFFWSWLGGTAFFAANMWWLWQVTGPGMVALVTYLGLFFGFAAWIFVGSGLVPRSAKPQAAGRVALSVVLIPVIWTALEYVRGNWSMFGNQGLPWLYLGNTQSPFLTMCQIADVGGVYAVTFWVVLVNALVFRVIVERRRSGAVIPAFLLVLILIVSVAWYGASRISQTSAFERSGPTVLVVQPNIPQSNSGEKGAPPEQIVRFHVETTQQALKECAARGQKVDLVAWSETMMPPINPVTRDQWRGMRYGEFLDSAYQQIANLASEHHVAIIAGGIFTDQWRRRGEDIVPADRRNSAYFFDSSGLFSGKRYDKIHLVPFGEFIPWSSIPPVYKLLVALGPNYYEDYVLTPGTLDNLTVFEVNRAGEGTTTQADRFVVPICFEDIDPPLVAQMFRAPGGTKRADFIVNLTNDGWFTGGERPQHFQAAIFRSIENRAPTARTVNTGISGFIDSIGSTRKTIPANSAGWGVYELTLDSRVTFYTLHGDTFVLACANITGVVVLLGLARWVRQRRSHPAAGPEGNEEQS